MEGIYHDADLKESPEPKNQSIGELTQNASPEDFSSLPVNQNLENEEKDSFVFPKCCVSDGLKNALFGHQQSHIGGFLHLYIGQEAVAVGSVSVMDANDHVITAYRDHGHALAVGMDMDECMAELFGKQTDAQRAKVVPCISSHQIKTFGAVMV